MDFTKEDIPKILKSAIKNRFSDFNPFDFEDFIAQLFKANNYSVEQTKYSGDFGADIIIEKDNSRIVVQVKRYAEENKVGVKDINQLIGAKEYYKCDSSIIVTTSSYSAPGIELANNTGVILYEWDHLLKMISDTYLDGKDYYEYFRNDIEQNIVFKNLEFRVKNVDFDMRLERNKSATLILLDVINNSEQNLNTNFHKGIYIGSDRRQVEFIAFLSEHFSQGTIYSGCTVEVAFLFPQEKISSITPQDKIIIEVSEGNDEPVLNTYSISVNHNSHRETYEERKKAEEESKAASDKMMEQYYADVRNKKIKRFIIIISVIAAFFILVKMCISLN